MDRIVQALFDLGKPSTSKEIKEKDPKLPEAQATGRGAAFLVYLGLVLEKGGRNKFELSEPGRQIAVEKVRGNEQEATKLWQQALSNHPVYGYIKDFVAEKGGGVQGSPIGLGDYLKEIAKEDWGKAFVREGGRRLVRLYASKGLLTYDVDKDTFALGEVKPIAPLPPQNLSPQQPQAGPGAGQVPAPGAGQSGYPPAPTSGLTTTVSIEVTVDTKDDNSVSNLIDVIRALRGEKVERKGKDSDEQDKTA